MRTRPFPGYPSHRKNQCGSAVLIILAIIGIGAAFLLVSALNKANSQIARDKITSAALAQAKEALIGYAATYRDNGPTHTNEVFGYLLLPDLGSNRNATPGEGITAGSFAGNAANTSAVGRLPWKTLGLAPLRDGKGECLWYAISGAFQEVAKAPVMNWDTLGQFDTYSSNGTPGGTVSTVGPTNYHQRPVAVIFAPGVALTGQNRTLSALDTVTECGGNYDARNYLDTFNPNPLINNIVNYFTGMPNHSTVAYLFPTTGQLVAGPVLDTSGNPMVNDRVLTITPDDLFRVIKKRSDFKDDIDTMMIDLRDCLNSLLPASLPPASLVNKGIDNVIAACPAVGTKKKNVQNNWQDNLLYAKLPTPTKITILSSPASNACPPPPLLSSLTANACTAVLLFGGERTTRTFAPFTAQTRASAAQKGDAFNPGDSAMYLEGANANSFPAAGTTYSGASKFCNILPAQDLVACITGILPGTTLVSFANSFGSFTPVGSGVTTDPVNETVAIGPVAGASGGCFWYPTAVQLNGKTLRAYYDFAFTNPDPIGGADLGNGFTLSLLRGDVGPPTACGTKTEMGILNVSTTWGTLSYFVETDVHHDNVIQLDNINIDPAGNHTSIMANGNLTHSVAAGGNGYTTAACDGTAQGCAHSPADKFEESPTPLPHNQRIEIHTGYSNATCTVAGGSYAQIKVWVDCTSCNDTSTDLAAMATASRCTLLDPALNTFYFGLTGGFLSGANAQGVTIQNLDLRTQ